MHDLREGYRLRTAVLLVAGLLSGVLFDAPVTAWRAAEPPSADELIAAAWAELRALEAAGAALAADESPVRTRALELWSLGRRDPAGAQGARASTEALRLLMRIGRTAEATAKAATLGPDEAAWEPFLLDLLSAAQASRSYDAFVDAVHLRLEGLPDAPAERA